MSSNLDSDFDACIESGKLDAEVCVAEAAVSFKPTGEASLHWLALNLTPGLGPTKARKLVEHFGGVANIFKATLTELEATGIQTVSAQSLGTGR